MPSLKKLQAKTVSEKQATPVAHKRATLLQRAKSRLHRSSMGGDEAKEPLLNGRSETALVPGTPAPAPIVASQDVLPADVETSSFKSARSSREDVYEDKAASSRGSANEAASLVGSVNALSLSESSKQDAIPVSIHGSSIRDSIQAKSPHATSEKAPSEKRSFISQAGTHTSLAPPLVPDPAKPVDHTALVRTPTVTLKPGQGHGSIAATNQAVMTKPDRFFPTRKGLGCYRLACRRRPTGQSARVVRSVQELNMQGMHETQAAEKQALLARVADFEQRMRVLSEGVETCLLKCSETAHCGRILLA